jgi:hypothetical protein
LAASALLTAALFATASLLASALLTALLSGGGRFDRFFGIVLCVHGAFLYY